MEVVSASDAKFLLRSSLTVLASCAGAAYFGLYDCLMTSSAVLVCSLNYWRRPVYGWRRNIDILNIVSCTLYHCWRALETTNTYFFVFTAMGVGSYILSRELHNGGAIFRVLSKYAHSGMHIFGNIANAFLYVNLYKPGSETMAACEIALVALLVLALADVMFIGGWPPKWWPKAICNSI